MSAKRVSRALGGPSVRDEPSEIRLTFARNLRHAREAAELTQHALARVAACDPRLLANIETRAANVKLDTITRLARALGMAEIDLLSPDMVSISIKRDGRPLVEPLSETEPTQLRRQLARNLREKRQTAGLYQKVLSKLAGVQGAAVAEIEVHAINVTLDTVTRLAKALGVTEVDLFGPENG